jgi:hypothetical protein
VWPDFLLVGQIEKTKSNAGRRKTLQKNFGSFLAQKRSFYKIKSYHKEVYHKSLLQGYLRLQNIFGGLHAARGSQFGHVCSTVCFTDFGKLKLLMVA